MTRAFTNVPSISSVHTYCTGSPSIELEELAQPDTATNTNKNKMY